VAGPRAFRLPVVTSTPRAAVENVPQFTPQKGFARWAFPVAGPAAHLFVPQGNVATGVGQTFFSASAGDLPVVRPLVPRLAAALLAASLAGAVAHAASVNIPNPSFESPVTPYVDTHINSWQKTPKPDGYVESGGTYWDQLAGTFKNQAPGSTDHIDNCHGQQAAWVFAVPEIGFFQDYDSRAWNDVLPSRAFDVAFTPGSAYKLTVAVIGGGGGMLPGVTLELSLYYRDAASNQVTVAANTITNGPLVFSNTTHFLDFEVKVSPVQPTDPWAGRKLGMRILSTVSDELQGGYWDVDHVRLVETPAPVLTSVGFANGSFGFMVRSEPGLKFEILAAEQPALPTAQWSSLGRLTNSTGTATFSDPMAGHACRFYQARQVQ